MRSPTSTFPHSGCGRRLHRRMPGARRRYLAAGSAGHPRTRYQRRLVPAAGDVPVRQRAELTGMAVLRFSQEGRSSGTTSRLASRPRTPSSKASMPACATNVSMRHCSLRSHRPEPCWRLGETTTTTPGRAAPWAISHQTNTLITAFLGRNGAGCCATSRAPRPAPLLHRAHGLIFDRDSSHSWMR